MLSAHQLNGHHPPDELLDAVAGVAGAAVAGCGGPGRPPGDSGPAAAGSELTSVAAVV